MPKVYVVQELRNEKGEVYHNFSSARDYGDIEVVLPITNVGISIQPLIPKIRSRLSRYGDEDYLICVGDPIVIGVAINVAAEINRGKVNLLRWEKERRCYFPISVDLRNVTA